MKKITKKLKECICEQVEIPGIKGFGYKQVQKPVDVPESQKKFFPKTIINLSNLEKYLF